MKTVRLGDVTEVVSGGTPKTSVSEYWGGEIPWATPKDLSEQKAQYISSTSRTITQAGLDRSSAVLLPRKSVLLSSRAPIGLVAINTVDMATNQGFKSLVPDSSKLDYRYLYHWMKANVERMVSLGVGATFKEISKKVVSNVEIPLPSLAEQRRIAGILDAASAGVAGAEIILDRIEQAPVEVFRRLFHNFPSIPLGSVAQLKSGSTPSKDRGELWDGDFPWFTAKDFKSSTLAGSLDRIAPPEVSAPRVPAAPAGSVLCVVRGMILAHTFPVSKILVEGSFNQDVKWLRVDQREVLADFLLWGLRSKASWVLDRAETSAHGTKRIPTNVLLEVSIPRASISEQDEFKMIIQKISEVKERAREVLKRRRELFSALQYRAFRGEL
ncbi:restriction endonuclease subunit S [Rothia kristinae]|uniref:restriction endonuclease subunit S n=1 Tax=Rothia kristinae TaxID=37923 RepID=UPI00119CD64D|nr:restriction endonuclease subunit S [Rothia kristinae]